MIDVMSTAVAGMGAAGARLEDTARRVASYSAPAASEPQASVPGMASVRIVYLPLPSNPIEDMAYMVEDEAAFKLNAAVFKTADEMFDALLKAVG